MVRENRALTRCSIRYARSLRGTGSRMGERHSSRGRECARLYAMQMVWRTPMTEHQQIYCCGCGSVVGARLTDGREIYPGRRNLRKLPFWRCDCCGNFVGCHWKTKDRTMPLGSIPTPELRNARKHLHLLIDPLWQSGRLSRADVYARLSDALGRPYHTGEINSVDDARQLYRIARTIAKEVALSVLCAAQVRT